MHNSKRRKCFNVRRNGVPIRKYFLKPGLKVGITYERSFLEVQACIAAGLDYHKWRTEEYSPGFRAEVVAWYEMRGLIEQHVESVKNKAMEKKD